MITALLFIIGILILGLVYLFITRKKTSIDPSLFEWMKSMQASLDTTQKTLYETLNTSSNQVVRTLQENTKQVNERLDKAAQVIKDVNLEVGKMTEIGHNMKELQEFLKSPKLRGNIGEQILKDLISQTFPKNNFHLQYEFKSGEKVDAVIQTDAGFLPIDAKFPMENFQKMIKAANENDKKTFRNDFSKDVRKHIDAISKKYILPDEGTMDFALMYVPSESVFYEIVNLEDVMDYARAQRIYIVSPSTLYAHLQTILLSFEGKKIESRSKQVFQLLRALRIDYSKLSESLDLLGKHLNNASNQFTNVDKSFAKMGNKLISEENRKLISNDED